MLSGNEGFESHFPHFYDAWEVFKCLKIKIASWTPIRPPRQQVTRCKTSNSVDAQSLKPGFQVFCSNIFPLATEKSYSSKKIAYFLLRLKQKEPISSCREEVTLFTWQPKYQINMLLLDQSLT